MNSQLIYSDIKPFVKWAGGKSQLLKTFEAYFHPELSEGKIKKYSVEEDDIT